MAGATGPIRSYQLTLDATVQQLSDVVPAGLSGDLMEGNPLFAWIDLQADDGNSNPVYVGDSGVSAVNHGVRIPTPTTGVPDPPWRSEGPQHLSALYVIGTNAEKLNITGMIA